MPALASGRVAADQAFSRAAGAPLVDGNAVRLLKDGAENYPAWLAAIAAAERFIHFEMYIVHDDQAGAPLRRGAGRARQGRRAGAADLRLGRRARRHLAHASGTRSSTPASRCGPSTRRRCRGRSRWLVRDHRKMLAVDGARRVRVGAVRRRRVGRRRRAWSRGATPASRFAARRWPTSTPSSPTSGRRWARRCPTTSGRRATTMPAGRHGRRSAWSARGRPRPACCGSTPWSPAWRASGCGSPTPTSSACPATCRRSAPRSPTASTCGCSCPGGSDLPLVRSLSRAGYRGLLEGGVRVFEWNGSMVHAKTAVADGLWARVGSTNLNIQSWMGNWELDVAVEDAGVRRGDGADVRGRPRPRHRSAADEAPGPGRCPTRRRAPRAPAGTRDRGAAGGAAAAPAGPRPGPSDSATPWAPRSPRTPPAGRRRGLDPGRRAARCSSAWAALAAWWPAVVAYPVAARRDLARSEPRRRGLAGPAPELTGPVARRLLYLRACTTCR